MSKGEEEQATGERAGKQRKFIATEKIYCHQCQRGRLLEMLSLMAKEAVDAETGTVTRRQRQIMEAKKQMNEAKETSRGSKYRDKAVFIAVEAEAE